LPHDRRPASADFLRERAAMNAIPAEYKQTEVGVIPADWDVESLGDLSDFITSGSRGWAQFYSTWTPNSPASSAARLKNIDRYPAFDNLSF
jgi:type I restriction enzyme S subunit